MTICLLHQRTITRFLEIGLSHCSQNVTGLLLQCRKEINVYNIATNRAILCSRLGYNFTKFHLQSLKPVTNTKCERRRKQLNNHRDDILQM